MEQRGVGVVTIREALDRFYFVLTKRDGYTDEELSRAGRLLAERVDSASDLPEEPLPPSDTSAIYGIGAALGIIMEYGGCDGADHKQWTLDQVVQALCGSGPAYEEWVRRHNDGEDGPNTFHWGKGIAP
jgi:hypothetical protein